jgi:hypothetical protein
MECGMINFNVAPYLERFFEAVIKNCTPDIE